MTTAVTTRAMCAVAASATLLASATAAHPAAAQAGVLSGVQGVAIDVQRPAAITVAVLSGASQSIPSIVQGAVHFFPSPVSIRTAWDLHPSTGSLSLLAYFATPAQALANGTSYLASSTLKGRVPTGLPTTYTPFTQNGVGAAGTAAGSLRLFAVNITGVNKRAARTDNLELQLDLTGVSSLTAGTYAGTLNLRAVTQ